jgi:tRNA(Ile)-lysidine synthetase-like protein
MFLNEKNFLSHLKNFKYFENQPKVALGVSGGPDSMALASLLHKWIKLQNGKLTALVFDHGIRFNSKDESLQVKSMLTDLNIETVIIKPNKNKLIKKNMANARDNRFEGMINYCKKNNILHLFLGHHFDDNLETYLIRKINGSNLDGLASINDITYFNNIIILRPLIEISKSSILNFNKKNKVKFINDPSNKDINYTRVKVRKFLQNKTFKTEIKNDFLNLKKQIPIYRKMIWEIFIGYLIDVSSNRVKISFNKLIKNDDLIIEKHILLLLRFLTNNKNQTKSSKIMIFINSLKKPSFKTFNLSGVTIQKSSYFLIFSQK